MTQIDSARLSRVLASLTKPKERADSTAQTDDTGTTPQRSKASSVRDPAVLRARLSGRLKTLRRSDADFAAAAPIVTVQEILRWEFGEDIFQHPEFERIADQVASALMSDEPLKSSMENIIRRLSEQAD